MSKPKKIELSNYSITRTIGQGAFGTVKLAKNKQSNKLVAIKLLKKYDLIKNKQVDHVHDEVTLIANMDHPLIVKFDGFTQDDRFIYLAMEFVQGGEFFIYLRSVGKLKPQDAAYQL